MSSGGVAGDGFLGGFTGTLSYLFTWALILAAAIVAMLVLYIYLPLRKQEGCRYYAAELSCMTGLGLFLLLQLVFVRSLEPLPTVAFLLLIMPIGVKSLFSSLKDAVRGGAESNGEIGRTVTIVSSSSTDEEDEDEDDAGGDVSLVRLGRDRVRGFSAVRVNPTSAATTFGDPQSCVAMLTALSKFQGGARSVEWVFKVDVHPSSGVANYSFIAAASGKDKRRNEGAGAERNCVEDLVRRAALYLKSSLFSVGFTPDDVTPMSGVELLKSVSESEENSGRGVMVSIRGLPQKLVSAEDLECSVHQKLRSMPFSSFSSSPSASLFHPVGRLVRFMVAENVTGSYVVRFKKTRPPEGVEVLDGGMVEAMNAGKTHSVRGGDDSPLFRIRNSAAGRLRLAEGEELAEEVMAGVRRGFWSVESYVVMPGDHVDADAVVKVSPTIVSCFSGGVRSVDTDAFPIQSPSCGSNVIDGCHSFISSADFRRLTGAMSSDSLATFITLAPPYPALSCEASLAEFETPSNNGNHGDGFLHLGKAYFRGTPIGDVRIPIEDLAMHEALLGETGLGKTTFVADQVVQLWNRDPTINWAIIDLKGEYYRHLQPHISEKIVVLEAGRGVNSNPLCIDLLSDDRQSHSGEGGEGSDSDRIGRLFSALKESLGGLFKENSELSPMMERILYESLKTAVTPSGSNSAAEAEGGGSGFFDALFREVEKYVIAHKRRDVAMSGEALKNRLERFRRGVIGDILNSKGKVKGSVPREYDFRGMLRSGKVIIDLSGCVRRGCSKEDIRLLLNMITSVIFEEAFGRGLVGAPALRHLTVIEEANLLVPDVFRRKTMGDLTATEDMILTARGFGEGLILVAQRPTMSSFVLANAGTKVVFRSPYDASRVGKLMGLSEEQESAVKSLRKFEALVTTVQGGPYKVSTAKAQQPAPLPHPRKQEKMEPMTATTSPSGSLASSAPVAAEATEVNDASVEGGRVYYLQDRGHEDSGHAPRVDGASANDDNGVEGSVAASGEDAERLLKRKGTSSDVFKLFKMVASSSSSLTRVPDAIVEVFGGKLWRYLDTIRSLSDTATWTKPLVNVDDSNMKLTEYGREVWEAIQQRRGETSQHRDKKAGGDEERRASVS